MNNSRNSCKFSCVQFNVVIKKKKKSLFAFASSSLEFSWCSKQTDFSEYHAKILVYYLTGIDLNDELLKTCIYPRI